MGLTAVFSQKPGVVFAFEGEAKPAIVSVKLDGFGGFDQFKSIISRIAFSGQVNAQILHAFGGDAFIYVFGDRVGQIVVSGLSFENTCNGGDDIGIEKLIGYYNEFKASNRKLPITVTIGAGTSYPGYLFGINSDVEDTPNRIWRYSLVLMAIPPPRRRPAKNAAANAAAANGEVQPQDNSNYVSPGEDGSYEWTNTDGTADSGGYNGGSNMVAPVNSGGFTLSANIPNTSIINQQFYLQ